ncbi:hypothetical protein [Marinobacter sp.]|uniref:hypothetical protein n=1 Tax=Marinobacter sp. TaxID=50741 RepID=UPI002354A8A0|nr:hypothetical protein [Marinobacter sp.]
MNDQEMQELFGVDPTEERRGVLFENIAKRDKAFTIFEGIPQEEKDAFNELMRTEGDVGPTTGITKGVEDRALQAVQRDFGNFSGIADPTGMMRSGDAREDRRRSDLDLLESRRILEGEDVFIPSFRDPEEASEEIFAYQDPLEPSDPFELTVPDRRKSLSEQLAARNMRKSEEDNILDRFADIGISALGGTSPETGKPRTITTQAGLVSAIEIFPEFLVALFQENARSSYGAYQVLTDSTTYSNILDSLKRGFSPVKTERNFLPSNKTAALTFLSGRQDAEAVLDVAAKVLRDNVRKQLGMDDDVSFQRFYRNVRGIIEIPAERETPFTKAAAVGGMLTLSGGSIPAGRTGMQLIRNTGRVYAAARVAGRTGVIGEGVKGTIEKLGDTFFNRQVLNVDFGKTYIPDRFYKALTEGESIDHAVKAFQFAGVPREKAVRMAKNARRDFHSAVFGGALYSMFDSIFNDELISMGGAFIGSILGNQTAATGRALFSRGFLNAVTRLAAIEEGSFRKSIEAFRNSDFKGMNKLRDTFLRVHGLETADINAARRSSFTQGEEVLAKIRNLEKEGNASQAIRVKNKAMNEGLLDDKGRAHGWYVLGTILESGWTKNNINYGATFHKLVLEGNEQDANQYLASVSRIQELLDNLYTKAPKAMEKFPLLFEQVTGFAQLQAMRNALMSNLEFSSLEGKVVSGALISETEKFQELLSDQAIKLKEALQEFTKAGDVNQSAALQEIKKDINKLISEKNLDFDIERLQKLKRHAETPLNVQNAAIQENIGVLKQLSGIENVGNEIVRREMGKSNISLLQNGFSVLQKRAKEPFEVIKRKYIDLEMDVSDFVTALPATVGNIEPNVRSLLINFGKFDNATMYRLYQKVSTNFFKKQMGLSSREAISTPEQYQAFQTEIKKFINQNPVVGGQGTAEEKIAIFNDVMQNARRIEQSGEFEKYSDLANMVVSNMMVKYEIPAKLNVETLMTMRSAMGDMARQRFNSFQFDEYRIIKDRINQFDTTLQENAGIFGTDFVKDYENARKHYADVFEPYLDTEGPFAKIANTGGPNKRQPAPPSQLFQQFFINSDDTAANARQFAKVFSDVDGNIQPEAIDALLFSITDYMVDSYNNVNLSSLDKVVKTVITEFAPMIRQAGKGKYVDTLEDMASVLSKDTKEVIQAREDFGRVVRRYMNNTIEARKNVFETTVVAQFGSPRFDKYGINVASGIREHFDDYQKQLLSITGGDQSIAFDSYENFIFNFKNSDEYADIINKVPVELRDSLKSELDSVLSNSEFVQTFKKIGEGPRVQGGNPTIKVIVEDAKSALDKGFMSQADYDNIIKNAGILIDDNFMRHMFPYINRSRQQLPDAADTMQEASQGLSNALMAIANERRIPYRKVLNQLRLRDSEIMLELNRKGFTNVEQRLGVLRRKFKFNVEHEYDMVSAQNWWDKNKEAYALVKDKEHMEFIENLMELGSATRGLSGAATRAGNVPREYTVMQGLGRLYNTFGKHVVSPAYIGMEKVVVDYRVARANIVKDLLTNKESANFIKNVYVQGLFEPRKARDYIKRMAFQLALTGHKLTSPNAVDEIYKELERTASEVRKEKET